MQPLCVGISTLLLSALLTWPGAGEFQVVGPAAPVIALLGKDAVLPCHLSPVTDAEGMEVTWNRLSPSGVVHHYATGQDKLDQQLSEYQGRTELLKKNLTLGQVSLRIHPIRLSDDGQYSCVFANSMFKNETLFTLLVTVSGSTPRIRIETGGIEKIKLTCTSMGWYPQPEVQWKNLKGQTLTSASQTKTTAKNGLFHVETSVTVDTQSLDVSCVIRNPVLEEEKDVSISLTDSLFPEIWPWILGFSIPLFILICLCLLKLNIYHDSNLSSHADDYSSVSWNLPH